MQVLDDSTQQTEGFIDRPLIDPDTGKIIGFFVVPVSFGASMLFLQSIDIAAWGTVVHIRSVDCLCPPEDVVRLRSAFEDPRTFLGQPIKIKKGATLGILADVQFNTKNFIVEWLFPRKFFFLRQPVAVTEILEVTKTAIWIKGPARTAKQRLDVELPKVEAVLPTEPAAAMAKH